MRYTVSSMNSMNILVVTALNLNETFVWGSFKLNGVECQRGARGRSARSSGAHWEGCCSLLRYNTHTYPPAAAALRMARNLVLRITVTVCVIALQQFPDKMLLICYLCVIEMLLESIKIDGRLDEYHGDITCGECIRMLMETQGSQPIW